MKPESECQRLKIKNPDYTHFFPEHTLNKEAVFVLQVTIIDKLLLRLIDLSTPEIYHPHTHTDEYIYDCNVINSNPKFLGFVP